MDATSATQKASRAFARASWGMVVYLIGVILFGAWVRITHSGAGCGSHWPTCHGEIIPIAPSVETMIEFTHRLTSGLCGIFGIAQVGWAWRRFGAGSRVFKGAVVTLLFIIIEGAVGAGLVLKELVASDESVARAVVISLHLVNTLVLTAAASLTAWWAGASEAEPRQASAWRGDAAWLAVGLVALVVTSMAGAITALGDTLFPVQQLAGQGLLARVQEDAGAANHFLVRLRVVHPMIAVCVATYLLGLGSRMLSREEPMEQVSRRLCALLMAGVGSQVVLGLMNIVLAAPGWMQIVHLLAANLVWINALLLTVQRAQRPSQGAA
jgi:heme a synthase